MLIRLDLDQAAALHLAHALRAHDSYCDQHDYLVPPALVELARLADLAKTDGRQRPPDRDGRDTEARDRHADNDAPPVLSRAEFARAVGRSERTVRRWIAGGRVACGIPRSEVDRHMKKGPPHARR